MRRTHTHTCWLNHPIVVPNGFWRLCSLLLVFLFVLSVLSDIIIKFCWLFSGNFYWDVRFDGVSASSLSVTELKPPPHIMTCAFIVLKTGKEKKKEAGKIFSGPPHTFLTRRWLCVHAYTFASVSLSLRFFFIIPAFSFPSSFPFIHLECPPPFSLSPFLHSVCVRMYKYNAPVCLPCVCALCCWQFAQWRFHSSLFLGIFFLKQRAGIPSRMRTAMMTSFFFLDLTNGMTGQTSRGTWGRRGLMKQQRHLVPLLLLF